MNAERRTYGDHPSQFFDLYLPSTPTSEHRGTIISIHGGYWRAKYGLDLNEPMARHLANSGFVVANIEYRRIVEENGDGVWADMSSDILAVVGTIAGAPERVGPIIVLGHSAGGHLALWATAHTDSAVDGVIALAPLTDLFLADGLALSDHATQQLFGQTAAERPDLYQSASPLHLLPLNVAQLIVHGDKDDAVPVEMSIEYCETADLVEDDVTFIRERHVDHFHVIEPTHKVWREIDRWIEAR